MEWLSQYLFIRQCLRTHARMQSLSSPHTDALHSPGDRLSHRSHVDERCKYKRIFMDEMNDLLSEKNLLELLRKKNILDLALSGGQDLEEKVSLSDHNTVTILGRERKFIYHAVTQLYKGNPGTSVGTG